MARVLVADDDTDLLVGLEIGLRRAGHEVACVSAPTGVLHEMSAFRPDVILLDVMMPGMDGWEVCRAVRQVSQVPIIFLTALRGGRNVFDGLDMGGDDYITKPFALIELLARIGAVIRRADMASRREPAPASYDDGALCVDLAARIVLKHGRRLSLGAREFQLLAVLLENAGNVMTHEQILRSLWGTVNGLGSNHVAMVVRSLRLKIEVNPSKPRYIRTRYGLGYYFDGQQEDQPEDS